MAFVTNMRYARYLVFFPIPDPILNNPTRLALVEGVPPLPKKISPKRAKNGICVLRKVKNGPKKAIK